MSELLSHINKDQIPEHVAIIMDGNGRWASKKKRPRIFGHKEGVASVREISEGAAELGIKYLTLYTFSTENWNRPELEISALMELLLRTIRNETKTLMKNGIRLKTIGQIEALPEKCYRELIEAQKVTKGNTRMDLILALSYSGRSEITDAVKSIAEKVRTGELDLDKISNETIDKHLYTKDIPDPELLIRTSGEYRMSNYLLWQSAYTELYFTDTLWPEFRKEQLYQAIIDYQGRERRFGKTSDQLKKTFSKI
ncbi:MAG: isoprenyl transferase [Chitinophagales bacterium]|nr:isoprenyl transferase [Chitinophagales bacterium]